MKKLGLTKSTIFPGKGHIDMLIEMCREKVCDEIFNDCFWSDGQVTFVGATEHVTIPWLEVCLVHVSSALANPNDRSWDIAIKQSYHLHEFYHHPKHPIDYLYREYQSQTMWKKLKSNKL